MPKILMVSPTGVLGGAERVMHNVSSYLLDEGWDVYFYVMSRGDQPGWGQLKASSQFKMHVSTASSEKVSILTSLFVVYKLSRSNGFDYIFSSHTHVNAFLSLLRALHIIKARRLIGRESTFIFDRFFGFKRLIFKLFYRLFYGQHDLLVCQTDGMQASLVDALGYVPAKKIASIPNPVNLKRIDSCLRDAPIKESSLDACGTYNIVACGRLVEIKGFDLLIQTFSQLVESGVNAYLTIVGDGPERKKLETLSYDLGVRESINFAGQVDNPFVFFCQSDLGVIPSEKEGFPNVVLEMMASKIKMIVSTPCTDGLSLLPDVLVCDSYSPDALFESMAVAAKEKNDFSHEYRSYVERHRSTEAFWLSLESLSGG